jgi:hypothetical protein
MKASKQEKIYLTLAAKMLDLAANEFMNHGCNDLDSEVIDLLETLDKQEFIESFNEIEEEEEDMEFNMIPDSSLMSFLEKKLLEFAKI